MTRSFHGQACCRLRAAALVAAALVVGLAPHWAVGQGAAPAASDWPWGARGSSSAGMGRLDLYNLGLLGAKARDPERAPAEQSTGKRQVSMQDDPTADRGPDRLLVEVLFPDGPAQKAGLERGDVITGVSGKPFKDGSLAPLAKAILDAESGASKGVVLTVERAEAKGKGATQVLVAVPVLGKEASAPLTGKARGAALDAALALLAERQKADGGFAETLSGKNGAVVQASMAGLAWLAAGSDLAQGPYAENVRKAAAFVRANAMAASAAPTGGANWDQSNWGVAHGAIFLGELQARSPDAEVLASLKALAADLAKRQETSGGWAHGPGGPNALGYVELNIVSGLSLMGMGLAREAGWEVPAETLAKARAYIEGSSSGDGGIGYSTRDGQQGQGNIGRTAAAWMGYTALDLRRDAWTKRMTSYIQQHADDAFAGHASLMQQILLAGLAAQALDSKAAKSFWSVAQTDLVLARSPDGSFQPRPWRESLQMGSNSDVSFGDIWTTAAWAIVLAANGEADGLPGLPACTGRLARKPKAK